MPIVAPAQAATCGVACVRALSRRQSTPSSSSESVVALDTSPNAAPTHWRQTILLLSDENCSALNHGVVVASGADDVDESGATVTGDVTDEKNEKSEFLEKIQNEILQKDLKKVL